MSRQVAGHGVDGVGQIFPCARHAGHLRLAAQFAVGSHFAGHARHFGGERIQLVHHGIERVLELQDFALHVHRDLAAQVAAGHSRRHFGNVSYLAGEVDGHEVHVVGQILPRAGNARDLRLAAQLSVGSHFAGHARHFAGERVQLVHHGVDGVFQFENFALHVDRNLAAQVAAGHGGCDFGNVSDLRGQVAGHRVYRVRQILPCAGHAGHVGLAAEPAFGSHFAGHARHFAGEPVELVHHGVQSFFQLQDFAAHVDGDFAGKIAVGDGGRYFGNVSDLAGQVAGHEVHVVGKILPGSGHAGHVGLSAQLAFRTHFAGHARHFAGERVELIHHGVDGVFQLQNFALHVDGDFAAQVAAGHGRCHFGNVSHLACQV